MLYPEDFLLKHIPSLVKIVDKKAWIQNRQMQISIRNQNLSKESHKICVQVNDKMIIVIYLLFCIF